MTDPNTSPRPRPRGGSLRNVWAVSGTSFLTDASSEMVHTLIPLLLANVLGIRIATIGFIEGVAESTASLLKLFSGAISDRLRHRKWLAVGGYLLSALAKPGFYFATTWSAVAGVRWIERAGKGVRTAPRDALLADSVTRSRRGLAFGFHRAADTAGAVVGLLIAVLVVNLYQGHAVQLGHETFRTLVLVSLVPAFLAVATLAFGAVEPATPAHPVRIHVAFRGLGRRFFLFLGIAALFDLGNFSDAFLILRAQERGVSVTGILWILIGFNIVYALLSTPGGHASDRWGRKPVLLAGWFLFAMTYLGFAVAQTGSQIGVLYALYGAYYALCAGTGNAFVADLVPADRRGTAYGAYHATLGLMNLPASLLAGVLWQGVGAWPGLGPAAPFLFGSITALTAIVLLATFLREPARLTR